MKKKEAREIFTRISRSNSISYKKELINKLLISWPQVAYLLSPGQILHRFNKIYPDSEGCPSKVERVSYPPVDQVKVAIGRCNHEDEAVLYTSANPEAALRESKLEKGDLFIWSTWRVNQTIACKSIGYSQKEFLTIHKEGEALIQWMKTHGSTFDHINKVFNSWFSNDGSNYYDLTASIASNIMRDELAPKGDEAIEINFHDRIAILYKSLAYPRSAIAELTTLPSRQKQWMMARYLPLMQNFAGSMMSKTLKLNSMQLMKLNL